MNSQNTHPSWASLNNGITISLPSWVRANYGHDEKFIDEVINSIKGHMESYKFFGKISLNVNSIRPERHYSVGYFIHSNLLPVVDQQLISTEFDAEIFKDLIKDLSRLAAINSYIILVFS